MSIGIYPQNPPAIRVADESDWPKIIRWETALDIWTDYPYKAWGYTLTLHRVMGEMRYHIHDQESIAPVGYLVVYEDPRVIMRVEDRRLRPLMCGLTSVSTALCAVGEHLYRADRAAS